MGRRKSSIGNDFFAIRGPVYRCGIRRRALLAGSAAVLAACGIAAASAVATGTSPAGVTITITVPNDVTSTTITVPRAATTSARPIDVLRLKAAYADPSKISAVADARTRGALQAELRDLDAFLAGRSKLHPYRAHLWYVAHHTQPPVTARRLAALLWCTVWYPHDCG